MNIDLVAIIAIVFGTSLTGLLFYKIINFIQFLIDRKRSGSHPDELKQRLSELEHNNHRMEKRIQNLETILVDNDMGMPNESKTPEKEQPAEDGVMQNKLRNRS